MATTYGKDIEALHKRLNALEQGGAVAQPQVALPTGRKRADLEARIDELHAELSRLSQGIDRVAALEARLASLEVRL